MRFSKTHAFSSASTTDKPPPCYVTALMGQLPVAVHQIDEIATGVITRGRHRRLASI